ncbi:MAG: elongation factor G, partial [Blastopirellula sp.]
EDPSFRVSVDHESGQTIMRGMGELHLDILVDRMRREFKVEAAIGAPQVAYRESITKSCEISYTHKKQSGGSGQFAKIELVFEPGETGSGFEFTDSIVGGSVPKEYIPGVKKGLETAKETGIIAGFPVLDFKVKLVDGGYHDVDSSEMAFRTAAKGCFRENFMKMKPTLLEPIMKVEIEVPESFQGPVTGDCIGKRGMIAASEVNQGTTIITAEIPLASMFGYATDLRSMTQGQGTFSMELDGYKATPRNIQEDIIEARRKEREEKK